jgi:hypothetical protein
MANFHSLSNLNHYILLMKLVKFGDPAGLPTNNQTQLFLVPILLLDNTSCNVHSMLLNLSNLFRYSSSVAVESELVGPVTKPPAKLPLLFAFLYQNLNHVLLNLKDPNSLPNLLHRIHML